MKKKYIEPIARESNMSIENIMIPISGHVVSPWDTKKRNTAIEDPFDDENDESEDSFWGN